MIPNFFKGKFFVFEGIDGCGKSEQVARAERWIYRACAANSQNTSDKYLTVKINKEPNKKHEEGRAIYADLKTEGGVHETNPLGFQTWYARDRKRNLQEIIIPSLSVGSVVLSDRYCPSLVYGVNRMEDMEKLMIMQKEIVGEDFIWPDAILIFDVSIETALARLKLKNVELDEHERAKVLHRVRLNYMAYARKYPGCHLINAEGNPDEVFKEVITIMLPILNQIQKAI